MPNYYYIDSSGTKSDPLNEQQLQAMVAQGVFTPTTPLETDTGHKGFAGQIPGLKFNTATSSPFAQTAQQAKSRNTQQDAASIAMSIKSWLLDFTFRDLRLPVINLWACRIIYVVCCVAAILMGLWATIMFFVFTISSAIDFLIVILIATPLTWLSVILFILSARLLCEWYIIVFDWIVATTKAAQIYTENNERK